MSLLPFADVVVPSSRPWGLGELLIALIVVCGVVAIAFVALRAMAIPVPQWVWHILGIVLLVVVAVVAIRFLLSI